jgi:hypothetical protein
MSGVVEKLLSSEDPCVRYRALVDACGQPRTSPQARREQEAIRSSSRAVALLSHRDESGRLTGHAYSKFTGAHWTLADLADIGYPPATQPCSRSGIRSTIAGSRPLTPGNGSSMPRRPGPNRGPASPSSTVAPVAAHPRRATPSMPPWRSAWRMTAPTSSRPTWSAGNGRMAAGIATASARRGPPPSTRRSSPCAAWPGMPGAGARPNPRGPWGGPPSSCSSEGSSGDCATARSSTAAS